jgi:two-component system, cell cycle response regulator
MVEKMNRLANILIAGSERNRTDQLCDLLSENNCNALVCTGIDDLTREAREGRPDLIVVEIDGVDSEDFAAAKALRSDPELSLIPTVGWYADEVSSPENLFSRAIEENFQDLYLGPPKSDEIFTRFRPLMRFSTQIAELRRRTALAGSFGVGMPKTPDLSIDTQNYSILAISCEGNVRSSVGAAVKDAAILTDCASLYEARDLLFDGKFDAAVVTIADSDAVEDVFEFCEEVRNNPRLFNLPIIVLADKDVPVSPIDVLSSGASRFIQSPSSCEEIRFNLKSLADLQRRRWQIYSAIQETKSEKTCDPETGSYNLEFQRAHLDRLVDEAREWQRHVTVLFFSLSGPVSAIRDEFGKKAASNLFVQVAHWIERLIRLEDLSARFGKTEICVALPDTPLEVAEAVMQRVSGILGYTDFAVPDVYRPIRISVSVGAAELEFDDDSAALIARAHESWE